ncbi:MAG: hypothetical protein F6K47_41800, partial [Symploca sp. SIO2E6]|nr:hypothetical protein [Symploca sp. SIO2E6]
PAIDVALKDHVQQADEFLGQILRRVGEKRGEMEALAGFPKHFWTLDKKSDLRQFYANQSTV